MNLKNSLHYGRALEDAQEDGVRYSIRRTGADVNLEAERYRKLSLVIALASLAHDDWRAPRKIDGTDKFEPRIKPVKDELWIALHGGQKEVDIANTPYSALPSDWQEENKASAEIAVAEVIKTLDAFIESVAALIHTEWVARNGTWASEELKKPYLALPEDEKEKDRQFVRRALEIYQGEVK